MAKPKFWQIKNLEVAIKAISTSIVTGLITAVPYAVGIWLVLNEKLVVGRAIQILTAVSGLVIWGWLARKFWGWK